MSDTDSLWVCSESGKFLVSLGGPLCRVWDVNASTAVASLSKEKVSRFFCCSFNFVYKVLTFLYYTLMSLNIIMQDELFASCRFSVDNSGDEVLYIAAKTGKLTFSQRKI